MTQTLIIESKQPLMKRLFDFVRRLDAEIGVEQAFLFGSTAKKRRRKNSDVDIIIVSRGFEDMPENKRQGFVQHRWRYVEDMEALTYTPEEFQAMKERVLMKEILAYAIDLTEGLQTKPC